MIGQVLGHYRVVAKIGEGGMGVVYRAHDEILHREVALKVVKKDARLDTSTGQNLLHEARASSSLAHPNICTIYEVGETNGDLYIVMELVQGKSLRDLCGDTGTLWFKRRRPKLAEDNRRITANNMYSQCSRRRRRRKFGDKVEKCGRNLAVVKSETTSVR